MLSDENFYVFQDLCLEVTVDTIRQQFYSKNPTNWMELFIMSVLVISSILTSECKIRSLETYCTLSYISEEITRIKRKTKTNCLQTTVLSITKIQCVGKVIQIRRPDILSITGSSICNDKNEAKNSKTCKSPQKLKKQLL